MLAEQTREPHLHTESVVRLSTRDTRIGRGSNVRAGPHLAILFLVETWTRGKGHLPETYRKEREQPVLGVQLQNKIVFVPHYVQVYGVAGVAHPVKIGAREGGWLMANHGETATKIKEGNPDSAGVPDHHTSREETKHSGTETGGEKEEQG